MPYKRRQSLVLPQHVEIPNALTTRRKQNTETLHQLSIRQPPLPQPRPGPQGPIHPRPRPAGAEGLRHQRQAGVRGQMRLPLDLFQGEGQYPLGALQAGLLLHASPPR
jgi:hypothetical protein